MKQVVEFKPEVPKLAFHQWYETLTAISEDLDRVLSFPQWAKLAGISERTGREIIERGEGPKVVQLSANRIGIRVCDHREWLAAKTRKTANTSNPRGRERKRRHGAVH